MRDVREGVRGRGERGKGGCEVTVREGRESVRELDERGKGRCEVTR